MLSAQSLNHVHRHKASHSSRALKNHPHRPKSPTASIVDRTFIGDAIDEQSKTWMLWVEKCGRSMLQFDGEIVAMLDSHDGAKILHLDECPFERAEDLILRITENLMFPMEADVRFSLESELARWVAENL